jgi:hypothetical protein
VVVEKVLEFPGIHFIIYSVDIPDTTFIINLADFGTPSVRNKCQRYEIYWQLCRLLKMIDREACRERAGDGG